jgi:hypothetical protein
VERKVPSFYSLDVRATQPHVLPSLKKIEFKSLNILHVLSCQFLVTSVFSFFIGVNWFFPSLLWVLFKSLAGFPCGLVFPEYFDFHLTPRL